MAPDFTIADVLAWARTKPADEEYDFTEASECAIAQFGLATGRDYLVGIGNLAKAGYPELQDVACPFGVYDRTFGGLVERLDALCPEAVIPPSEWTRLDAYMADIELASA